MFSFFLKNAKFRDRNHQICKRKFVIQLSSDQEIAKVYAGGSRFMFFYKLREGGSIKMIGDFNDLKYPGSKIEYRRTDLLN